MQRAFELGSGLCGSQLLRWHEAVTFLPCMLLVLWLLLGQWRQWTSDRNNEDQYLLTTAIGLSFSAMAGIFFLG